MICRTKILPIRHPLLSFRSEDQASCLRKQQTGHGLKVVFGLPYRSLKRVPPGVGGGLTTIVVCYVAAAVNERDS